MTGDDLLVLLAPTAPNHTLGLADIVLGGVMLALCGAITVVDLRHRIIPDICNVALAALGLVVAGLDGVDAVLAAATQGFVTGLIFWLFRRLYRAVRGHHGLGLGDVKFLGAAGIWVGLGAVPMLILVACGAALATVGVLRLRGHAVTAGFALPFGPFLVLGFLGVLAARFG